MMLLKKMYIMLKIRNIKDKIPDITNLATNGSLNAKINEVKGEIPNITKKCSELLYNCDNVWGLNIFYISLGRRGKSGGRDHYLS